MFPLPEASERELQVWGEVWTTPQAAAWAQEPWRHRTVAQWVRWSVRMEAPTCPASVAAGVLRMADQIGLSPAGLKENGWAIAEDEVTERRDQRAGARPVRRMRADPDADLNRPSPLERSRLSSLEQARLASEGTA